jgi:hypothetical protein
MANDTFSHECLGGNLFRLSRYVDVDCAVVIYEAADWIIDNFGPDGYVVAVERVDMRDHECNYSDARHFLDIGEALAHGDVLFRRESE